MRDSRHRPPGGAREPLASTARPHGHAGMPGSRVLEHGGLALGQPDLVRVGAGLYCLRFETMKVLSAMTAVEHLLATEVVRPGDTLVDSSSGIYAHALALACHRYDLGCHIVGSTTVDAVLRSQLKLLGATLEQMPPSSSLRHDQHRRVARVRELLADNPRMHWMRQYHDSVHRLGYRTVARLLRTELGTGAMTLVAGVGTGTSTAGLAEHLGELGLDDLRLVGVQPFGSVTFGAEHVADPDIIIAGIGSSIPFENVRHQLFDEIHWLSFETARAGTLALLRDQAIFAGLSSGAAYLAARWHDAADRTTVFLAPDTGHRYVDAVFARPEEACSDEGLEPLSVESPEALRLPWCRMAWQRRPAPTSQGAASGTRDMAP